MAGRRLLQLTLGVGIAVCFVLAQAVAASAANEIDYITGQNDDERTVLNYDKRGGGSSSNATETPAEEPISRDDQGESIDDPGPRGSTDVWLGDNWQQLCGANFEGDCSRLNEPAPPPTPPRPGGPVVVTLRDIASFRPTPPVSVMEPNGWAVVGVPANFVAEASSEVVSGILLGRTAEVRFTPVGYRWSHSDGAVVESASPGASWTDLGVAEFTPTGTSHVYAERGEYTVTLEVVLSAEYRFGGSGWQSIAGVLAVAGDPVPVLVGEVDTVLTNGDCRANPSGPGC